MPTTRFLALALVLAAPLAAQERPRDPAILHADESWTHVGDNNFSPESDAASDLTQKSAGVTLEIRFVLSDEAKALVAGSEYRSVVFKGTAIGNDTGKFGSTTATVVELNGKRVGEIERSGMFEIAFDEALLSLDPERPNRIVITTGQNGETDRDDQEMGMFEVKLSTKALEVEKE